MYRGDQRGRGGYSRSRGRGGGRNSYAQPKGLFADSIWHCDCTPRLPAEHFKVKKEGKNQGKWFYTCQQTEPNRCGFFLWDEDAKVREEAAVISGQRSEPGVQDGWNAGRSRQEEEQPHIPSGKGLFSRNEQRRIKSEDESTASPSPPSSDRPFTMNGNNAKRSALDAALEREDFGTWALSREEETALSQVGDGDVPITPHKAQKTGVYATPATTSKRKLPWIDEETQDTLGGTADVDYFSTPSKSRAADPQTPSAAPAISAVVTPAPPSRHRDALDNPADDASSLTSEVLAALSTTRLPLETLSTLRSILTKHDLRTQGIKKGRDISRLALKAKDAKIVELQARIASMEADQEVERSLARMKRWESGERGNWAG